MEDQGSVEARVAARAAESGISPATARLLMTGSLAVAPAVETPALADVQARMGQTGISEAAARLLMGAPHTGHMGPQV